MMSPAAKQWRGLLYCGAVGLRSMVTMGFIGLCGIPIVLALVGWIHGSISAGVIGIGGLLLLGVGLVLSSVVLARIDWGASMRLFGRPTDSPPLFRLRELRSVVRPLAYGVAMVTLGGAVSLLAALVVMGACVAMLSPVLVLLGDQAVIGPFEVRTWPQSALAVLVALCCLIGLVRIAPGLARMHATFATQVLTSPEQWLRRDLALTAKSRTRLVRAYDEERRRIERDLHDGVQPQLMSVNMTLGLALSALPGDAPGRADVVRAQEQVRQSLQALRHFVRNIHPQVLVDHGLGAAIAELADNLPLPIALDNRLPDRLPSEVETNLYFCVAELLTNTIKHAAATQAKVDLQKTSPDIVTVRVEDDGCGGAGVELSDLGGLAGIADRIAALSGQLTIDSPVGGPTRTTIEVHATDTKVVA